MSLFVSPLARCTVPSVVAELSGGPEAPGCERVIRCRRLVSLSPHSLGPGSTSKREGYNTSPETSQWEWLSRLLLCAVFRYLPKDTTNVSKRACTAVLSLHPRHSVCNLRVSKPASSFRGSMAPVARLDVLTAWRLIQKMCAHHRLLQCSSHRRLSKYEACERSLYHLCGVVGVYKVEPVFWF